MKLPSFLQWVISQVLRAANALFGKPVPAPVPCKLADAPQALPLEVESPPSLPLDVITQTIKLVQLTDGELAEANLVSRPAPKAKKRGTHKKHVSALIAAQRVLISKEITDSFDRCWRVTGERESHGDTLIFAPELDRMVPLIRVIFTTIRGEEPGPILRCGCGLKGDDRRGCVNPFPHDAENGHILIKLEKSSSVISRVDSQQLICPYPSKYVQPLLSDEMAEIVNNLLKVGHRLRKVNPGRMLKLSDFVANGQYKDRHVVADAIKTAKKCGCFHNWDIDFAR